jgi:hypothetical protein
VAATVALIDRNAIGKQGDRLLRIIGARKTREEQKEQYRGFSG